MSFLPENMHVLVIDDKIGDKNHKFNKHFDFKFKHYLYRNSANSEEKEFKLFKGDVYIHYCKDPADLEDILSKDSCIPIDIILLDINFNRISDNEFAAAFKYQGKEEAGFTIYNYLDNYIHQGINTIPKIIISGEDYNDRIGSLEDSLNQNKKESTESKGEKNKENNKNISHIYHYKGEENWIFQTAKTARCKYISYYKNNPLNTQKTSHLIDRLQKEIRFYNKLEKNEFTYINNSMYPHYKLEADYKIIKNKNSKNESCLLKKVIKITKLAEVEEENDYNNNSRKKENNEIECIFEKNNSKNLKNRNNTPFSFDIPDQAKNDISAQIRIIFKNLIYGRDVITKYVDGIENLILYGKYEESEITIDSEKCADCNIIPEEICMIGAIEKKGGLVTVNKNICKRCKLCIVRCPNNAIIEIKTNKLDSSDSDKDDFTFGGKKFKNNIFLAATPVTAINISDKNKIGYYYNKIINLYKHSHAGGIILKTVYLDKVNEDSSKNNIKDDIKYDNIRQYSVTRALSTETGDRINKLYNTGKTAKENLNVDELVDFLSELNESNELKDLKDAIILSLGSHTNKEKIWNSMFEKLFLKQEGKKNNKNNEIEFINQDFNFIEVNARHAMRRISRKCSDKERNKKLDSYIWGVDEYFISPDISNYTGFWNIFREWVELIQRLGIKYKKKLMLKLPYRSDLNMLVYIINNVIEKNSPKDQEEKEEDRVGIVAISAINTIKSPFPIRNLDQSEFFKIPQTSGYGLKELRNITLYTLDNISGDLDISASGGILTENDVRQCFALGAKTVQLSTWYLIKGNRGVKNLLNIKKTNIYNSFDEEFKKKISDESEFYFNTMQIKKIPRRKVKYHAQRCIGCGKCTDSFYCDAIMNKFNKGQILENKLVPNTPLINYDFCTGCGLCTNICEENALTIEYESALKENSHSENSDQIEACPICNNDNCEEKIYLYPKEYDSNNIEQQSYFCSRCKTIFTRFGDKDNFKIECLKDKSIAIHNRQERIEISITGDGITGEVNKELYNIRVPNDCRKIYYPQRIYLDIPHLLNVEISIFGNNNILEEENFSNIKGIPIKRNNRFDLHAKDGGLIIKKIPQKSKRIVLATGSKSRIDILNNLGLQFYCKESNVDEEKILKNQSCDISDKIQKLAKKKAITVKNNLPTELKNSIIVGVDTVFYFRDERIGKPADDSQVKRNLNTFKNKEVDVYTGLAFIFARNNSEVPADCVLTKVKFKDLNEKEIENYIAKKDYLGKAAGLSIQGAGAALIDNINGDYYNVVGLTIQKFIENLNKIISEK